MGVGNIFFFFGLLRHGVMALFLCILRRGKFLELHENKTIQYFCNYCLDLVNSWKFLSCIGLVSLYEKYYCLVLKLLIILIRQ